MGEIGKYLEHLKNPFDEPPVACPVGTTAQTLVASWRQSTTLTVLSTGEIFEFNPHDWNGFPLKSYTWTSSTSIYGSTGTTNPIQGFVLDNETTGGARLIAAGIRVTWIGRADDNEGYYVSAEQIRRDSTLTQNLTESLLTESALQNSPNTKFVPSTEVLELVYKPTDLSEFNFGIAGQDAGVSDTMWRGWFGIFGLSSTRKFRAELVITVEYIPTHHNAWLVKAIGHGTGLSGADVLTALSVRHNTLKYGLLGPILDFAKKHGITVSAAKKLIKRYGTFQNVKELMRLGRLII